MGGKDEKRGEKWKRIINRITVEKNQRKKLGRGRIKEFSVKIYNPKKISSHRVGLAPELWTFDLYDRRYSIK